MTELQSNPVVVENYRDVILNYSIYRDRSTSFTTPSSDDLRTLYFQLNTDRHEKWDADNPQVVVFLNGELVQGMDVNHNRCELEYDTEYDMYLYLSSEAATLASISLRSYLTGLPSKCPPVDTANPPSGSPAHFLKLPVMY